ncbi:hypothetical protein CPC08DRAFT_770130 [Agrocybe pediades]|nr:hypothetical protein CPC08DRAFT_770130 [Agrocybe pediades]
MADPLSITLAAITLGTALKDLTELALKLHESFKKHSHNMHAAESVAADTLEIVQDLESFYVARGDVLDNLPDVRDAVARLSRDMQSVHDQCLPILQLGTSPERGLRRTLFKIEQWRSSKVESDIRNLREQANKCYRRFTRHIQLGAAVAIGELKGAVSEGFSATSRQLSTLQVSDENVLAFMGSTPAVLSTLPPGVMLSEDLVFKLYIRGHVGKLDDILKNLASKHSYAVEEPDDRHTRPFTTETSFLIRTSEAIEYARGNTVIELIRVQQDLLDVEAGGNPIQEGASALHSLAIDVARLGLHSESLILCTWTIDLYKTLSKSHRDVYAPHLALAFFNLACTSYNTDNFAQAMTMTTESLSLLKTCAPTFGTEALTAYILSQSAYIRNAIGEYPSASLQDAKDSSTISERLGADQMAVIGPPQGGSYPIFVLHLTGGDQLIYRYAYALDAQRKFLYKSEKYQEALDVGERALQVYRRLAQCYKHVDIEFMVATLCDFLWDDVFRDIIPLSSALNYAQEAVQIWEEVQGPTVAKEEHILDSLAMQTKIFVEMGRPSDALRVFQKLARRVRTMVTNQRMYIHRMQDLASRLYSNEHYAEAATATRTIVEICRQTPDSFSTSHRFLVDILLDHIMYCDYANYLSEALIYSQEALAIAGQERLKDPAFINQYLLCVQVGWVVHLSLAAGLPEQAINQCQVSLNIDSSSFGYDDSNITLGIIYRKALAFLQLGRLSLAAATITEGYDFSESTKLNLQEEESYGWLLHVSALVHRCAGKQDDALTAIKAAIAIFDSCDEHQPLCILSDVQADMGHDAEALRSAEEAVQSTEDRASSSSPSDSDDYRTSQYSFCLRLFFNGELTRARQLILEVRSFYEWHAHSRNKWFINLARALRAEGILECASDRHAEGAAARTRLNELKQRLRATFPGLADQVEVDLNYERNYPAWKRLLQKHPLTCSHWVEEEAITGQEYTITHSILPPSLHPTSSLTPGGHDSRNEAVQIWEEVQGPTVAKEEYILDSLAMQTKIIVEMGRPSDALTVFQKLARRVRTMATNQRMYIHEMQDLASRLHSKKHYAEAATASRTIVEICRQAPDSLSTSHRFLIDILLNHINHWHCDDANYLSEALIYSQEALAIAGQEHLKDTAFIDQYLICVDWAVAVSLEAGLPEQVINQCQVALNIDSSSFGYDASDTILWIIYRKALAFLQLGRLSLAAATITEGYDFSGSTKHNLRVERSYGWLLHVSALVHRCAGKQDDALTTIKAAIPIFESCASNQLLYTLSDVQADMGYDAEGLCTAEENVQLTEKYASSSSPLDRNLYRTSQYSLCLRLFFNGEFTRARQLIVEVRRFYEWHAHSRNKWFINLARTLRAEGILECAADRHAEGAAARTRLNELQQRLRATFPGLADQVDVNLNYERNYPAWKRLLDKYPLTCSHWVEEEAITGQEYTITHSILPPSLHPTSSLTPGGLDSRNI